MTNQNIFQKALTDYKSGSATTHANQKGETLKKNPSSEHLRVWVIETESPEIRNRLFGLVEDSCDAEYGDYEFYFNGKLRRGVNISVEIRDVIGREFKKDYIVFFKPRTKGWSFSIKHSSEDALYLLGHRQKRRQT